MSLSAFGVDHGDISKALTLIGHSAPSDKRNTKYAGATAAGVVGGALAGSRVGAKKAGVKRKATILLSRENFLNAAQGKAKALDDAHPYTFERTPTQADAMKVWEAGRRAQHGTPGYTTILRGRKVGAGLGAAAAFAGYGTYRQTKRSKKFRTGKAER
jgi:hypothetical protein